MSTISDQLTEDVHTTGGGNASMLVAPTVSCWEAGRWELTRATLRRNSTSVHRPQPSSYSGMMEVSPMAQHP